MSKYKPNYWRDSENSEPIDYAVTNDPLHGGHFEAGRKHLIEFSNKVKKHIQIWLSDKEYNLGSHINDLEKQWKESGGNTNTWNTIMNIAYRESKYAKKFSKEANAAIKETPIPKPKPFNGLDFSSIKI